MRHGLFQQRMFNRWILIRWLLNLYRLNIGGFGGASHVITNVGDGARGYIMGARDGAVIANVDGAGSVSLASSKMLLLWNTILLTN